MSKVSYDDFLEDDPFFTPCIHCGCLDFTMDWEDNIYKCNDCNSIIDSKSTGGIKRKKTKDKVRKFKDYEV